MDKVSFKELFTKAVPSLYCFEYVPCIDKYFLIRFKRNLVKGGIPKGIVGLRKWEIGKDLKEWTKLEKCNPESISLYNGESLGCKYFIPSSLELIPFKDYLQRNKK